METGLQSNLLLRLIGSANPAELSAGASCFATLRLGHLRCAPAFTPLGGANGGCGGKEAKPPAPPTTTQRELIYGKRAPEGPWSYMRDEGP